MDKRWKTLIIVGVVAVAGYLAWRWYQNYKANTPGGGQLGTNLNSIAPELVGGSQGPTAQPAFNVPVNISVSSSNPAPPPEDGDREGMMIPSNSTGGAFGGSQNALTAQSDYAGVTKGLMPADDYQPEDNAVLNASGNGGDYGE